MKIVTLEKKHLEDAAKLAQASYRNLRQRLPIMPARYEQLDDLLEIMGELCREAQGVAALRGGVLVGFLAGLAIPAFMGKRAIYSPVWANGTVMQGSNRIYEEMYARIARQWLADRCHLHLISLLAADSLPLQAWQWLGFGLVNVDAVRTLDPVVGGDAAVLVRRANKVDAMTLSKFGQALEWHVASTPTFFSHELEDFGESLDAAGSAAWLAFAGDHEVGFIGMEPGENCECEFLQDEKTANITGAYVIENWRSRGVAKTLLNQALNWVKEEGYERCAVDFETANPLAARFWMRWFEPVAYSLLRWVDERL